MAAKPIRPDDLAGGKPLPDEVIEAFNRLIAENYSGGVATVFQKDAARLIATLMDIGIDDVFRRKLLDVEPHYEAAGWEVEYDRPAYCESYEAFFKFRRKEE